MCERPRRGYVMVELVMATLLLAAAMVLTVQILGWLASERRAADRRERAALEAANLMEHLTAQPWDAITPEAAGALELSSSAHQALPGAELKATVTRTEGDPPAKRIGIALRWRNRSGQFEAPVRLTAWVHSPGRARP